MTHKTPKSSRTKSLIEQTFFNLLAEQPLSKVGVKEIAAAAEINRNTFYYYFKNIPDLIENAVKNCVDETLAAHPPTYDSFEDCLITAIDLARNNKHIIYNIYNSTNRSIFERYLWKICDYTITSYIKSFPPTPRPLTPDQLTIIKDFLKFEAFGFIIDWLGRGMPDEALEKVDILNNLIRKHSPLSPGHF